jgi:hypothetical protein
MDRSHGSSRGVLGPVGLLLVAVLWLMTISGSLTNRNLAAPVAADDQSTSIGQVIARHFSPGESLTTCPTTHPNTGTGA